ncbi:MAG: hypothetical protein ACRDVP_08880 [Acidimicrobiales bacterium]
MRKYLTWRCLGLHLLVLVLVPGFLVAGWWQYGAAKSGNDLSWVYTVEWPLFALYALYMWWKLIHDQSTVLERVWAAKRRAAADASGTPIHEIPGWALDKELSRAVRAASIGSGRRHTLARTRAAPLPESPVHKMLRGAPIDLEVEEPGARTATAPSRGGDAATIDARVIEVKKVVSDEDLELDAYNRFLVDLHVRDPPKRWTSSKRRSRSSPKRPKRTERRTAEQGRSSSEDRRAELGRPANALGEPGQQRQREGTDHP